MKELKRKFYDQLMRWKYTKRPTISLNETLLNSNVPYGYKFIEGNVGVSGKKITLPHYMSMFL